MGGGGGWERWQVREEPGEVAASGVVPSLVALHLGQTLGAPHPALPLQVYDFDPIPPEPPATAQPNGGAGTRQGRPASTEPMALDGGGEEGEGPSGCAAEPAAAGAAASGAGAEEEGVEGRELGGLAYTVPPPPRPLPLPGEPGGGEGGPEAEEEGAAGSPGWRGQQEELRQAGLTLTPQEAAHILGGQVCGWLLREGRNCEVARGSAWAVRSLASSLTTPH